MFVLGFCRMQTSLRINRKSDEKWGMWSSWIFSASGYTMHTFTLAFPMVTRTLVYRRITNRARPWKWICRHVGEGDPTQRSQFLPPKTSIQTNPKKGNESGKFSTLPSCPRKKFKELIRKRHATKLLLVVPFKEHCKQMATACAPASLRNPRGWARSTGSSCCASRGCDFIRCAGRTQLPRRNPMTRCPFRWFVAHDRIHGTNGYICLHENHNNPVPWILWVVIWSASDLYFLYQIFAWGKAFYHAIQ